MIGDCIDANLEIEADDFDCAALDQRGGPGSVYRPFGAELPKVIEALDKELAA